MHNLLSSAGSRCHQPDELKSRSQSLRTHMQSVDCGAIRVAFESYGVRIGLQLPDADVLDRMVESLPPVWNIIDQRRIDVLFRVALNRAETRLPGDRDVRYGFWRDDKVVSSAMTLETAQIIVESVLQETIAERADPWLFVHAGVVGWKGTAIVLPGESFAGKSTLVAALVAAGATYYSDEYAVFDADGRVVPFARCVSLRDGPFGPAARINLAHHSPGQKSAEHRLPVGIVAFTKFEPGATWNCGELSPARGIMELCRHTIAIRQRPMEALTIFNSVAGGAHFLLGTRGEAASAANWCLGHSKRGY